MGMFDILHAPCPRCRTICSEQTKSGPCMLRDYHSDTLVPREQALFEGEVFRCEDCDIRFEVKKLELHSVEIKDEQ